MRISTRLLLLWIALKSYVSSRFCCWGLDSDGDFCLKVAFVYFVLYKWHNPTIQFFMKDFRPLDDTNTKPFWYRVSTDKTKSIDDNIKQWERENEKAHFNF